MDKSHARRVSGPIPSVSVRVCFGPLGFPDMNKKIKLTLGRLTIQSIELQVTTILKSIHGRIVVLKINPLRTDTGNFVLVQFKIPADSQLKQSRIFAIQRIGNCCDVWLEVPESRFAQNSTKGAA